MNNKGTKAISNSIHFKTPRWLKKFDTRNIDYIELSKNASKKEIDLFLIGLFGYNSVDFGTNPQIGFRNLIYEFNIGYILLGGGILFYDNEKKILPSCCCGLEVFKEILQAINNKQSPWMGHDPYPVFEYTSKKIIVWSDDCIGIYKDKKPKDNLIFIEFDKEELKNNLLNIENEIKEFIEVPFYNSFKELSSKFADELSSCLLSWLI